MEIIETIKWVGEDHPEIGKTMGDLLFKYDKNDYECMKNIVDTFNGAVLEMIANEKTKPTAKKRLMSRPSRSMLKHIIQQVKMFIQCIFI